MSAKIIPLFPERSKPERAITMNAPWDPKKEALGEGSVESLIKARHQVSVARAVVESAATQLRGRRLSQFYTVADEMASLIEDIDALIEDAGEET